MTIDKATFGKVAQPGNGYKYAVIATVDGEEYGYQGPLGYLADNRTVIGVPNEFIVGFENNSAYGHAGSAGQIAGTLSALKEKQTMPKNGTEAGKDLSVSIYALADSAGSDDEPTAIFSLPLKKAAYKISGSMEGSTSVNFQLLTAESSTEAAVSPIIEDPETNLVSIGNQGSVDFRGVKAGYVNYQSPISVGTF